MNMDKTIRAAFALLAGASSCLHAATYTWTPGVSGSWDDTTKWAPNGTPTAGDTVSFNGTYPADTVVTVGNAATVSFPQSTAISGDGALVLKGASSAARALTIENSAKDIQLQGGPLVFSDLDVSAKVVNNGSNNRFFLTGGGSATNTLLVLEGDSSLTLTDTKMFLSGDNNTQGSRLEINDAASLVMSGTSSQFQPGRGQNTWGGVEQRGGAVTCGGVVTFGNNDNSFGTWEMFSGTNTASAAMTLASGTGSKAGLYIHGGKFTFADNIHLGYNSSGRSEVFIDGGEVSFDSQILRLVSRASDSADYPSVLTIAGDANVHGFKLYPYGLNVYAGQSRAMLNLNGNGILSLSHDLRLYDTNSVAASRATISFNGGTLERVTGSPDSDQNKTLLLGMDAVVYPGGGKLKARKSDGTASGMNLNSAKFRKAGGWGVASIAVTSGGAGYLLPPLVDITGGSGSNATAVAQIDYETRQVTNVVVTCPGEGYAPGDTLAVSFVVPSKPAITAATATATLAENTAGTLWVVDGSTVSFGATFRYDGDFAGEVGAYPQITGDVTLGGTSTFRNMIVKDGGRLALAGPATAAYGDLAGLGTLAIVENGTLAVDGAASLRGTLEVCRSASTPLITVSSNCSFTPATGSSHIPTIAPAAGLSASDPIPLVAVSGSLSGTPALGGAEPERWRLRTTVSNGVTTLWLAPVAPTTIVLR